MLELYISIAIAALLFGLLFYQQYSERRKSRKRWHKLANLRRLARERERLRMQAPDINPPTPPQHLPANSADVAKN